MQQFGTRKAEEVLVKRLPRSRKVLREQFSPSEMTIGKKVHFRLRLNLIFKISCFCLCFMQSAIMSYQLRILDIIWASFGGDYSLVFSSHFWHSFDAFLKSVLLWLFCTLKILMHRWRSVISSCPKCGIN